MAFKVPPRFLRNSRGVLDLGPPADIGLSLWQYMCRRIGVADLAGKDLLDFGCGTRFADMLMNRDVPLRSYTGIDVYREMIDFLVAEAIDPRLSFHRFDARNPLYHPDGEPMTADTPLPVGDRRFDVICMFSVITHQLPDDALALFTILRRYVREDGRLFFSAYIDDETGADYREELPDKPTGLSRYSSSHLIRLLTQAGWQMVSWRPPYDEDQAIFDSFLCVPAAAP
jgi:SAM-dependent methyltransferase